MIDLLKRFGKYNSILIGSVHNNIKYTNFIDNLIKQESFDLYLLEINNENYHFIKTNDLYFSEFYPVIRDVENSKIVLIDTSKEELVNKYNQLIHRNDFFNSYISFKYNKYYYHKLYNILRKDKNQENIKLAFEFYENHPFYLVFIKFRELLMLNTILSFSNRKLCVIVGRNHFKQLLVHLSNLHINNM